MRTPPRTRIFAAALAVALFLFVGVAQAAYWDFQGFLAPSAIYVKYTNTCVNCFQWIRMSWTVNSHFMYWLRIDGNGTWHNYVEPGDDLNCPTAFDCEAQLFVNSVNEKFGCHNPGGLSTVYVNCRATNPL